MQRFFVCVAGLLVVAVLAAAAQSRPNGQQIFRYDTFGDEQLWTDTLQLH